jgi:hypothetical protein
MENIGVIIECFQLKKNLPLLFCVISRSAQQMKLFNLEFISHVKFLVFI